jgi:hypothetical protein
MILSRRKLYDEQGRELTHCPGCNTSVETHLTRIRKLPGESGGYKLLSIER